MKIASIICAIAIYLFMPNSVDLKIRRDVAIPVSTAFAAMNIFSNRRWY